MLDAIKISKKAFSFLKNFGYDTRLSFRDQDEGTERGVLK